MWNPGNRYISLYAARYVRAQRVEQEHKGWLFACAPCSSEKDGEAIRTRLSTVYMM